MFDVGFSELVLIGLLALIVLGPKRLPEVARAAGRWMAKLRHFVSNVKQDLDREMHNAEILELQRLKQELDDTRRVMQDTTGSLMRQVGATATTDPHSIGTTTAPTPAPLDAPASTLNDSKRAHKSARAKKTSNKKRRHGRARTTKRA